MITAQIDTIRYQALTKLVELGVESHDAYQEGKKATEAIERGLSIIDLLFALEQKEGLSEEEQENILYCLVEIAEINSFPTVPQIVSVQKPDVLVGIPGPQGPAGPQGESGEAFVDVISDTAYDNITVTEEDIGGIKTFKLGYDPYVASIASLVINNGYTREIGSSETVSFTASIDEGREPITSQSITTPAGFTWSSDPQTFSDTGVVIVTPSSRTYTAQVDDGTTIDSDSKNVAFVYPFFTGSSASVLTGSQVYADLLKVTEAVGDKSVAYSFTDEYAYFCFPEDYNDSSLVIKDENGFDVTNEWESSIISVTSGTTLAGGGGTDWTKNYKVWKTKLTTDINGTFQFLNLT